jgi:hypothetical protein
VNQPSCICNIPYSKKDLILFIGQNLASAIRRRNAVSETLAITIMEMGGVSLTDTEEVKTYLRDQFSIAESHVQKHSYAAGKDVQETYHVPITSARVAFKQIGVLRNYNTMLNWLMLRSSEISNFSRNF